MAGRPRVSKDFSGAGLNGGGWYSWLGSNQRPTDPQSDALPTELQLHPLGAAEPRIIEAPVQGGRRDRKEEGPNLAIRAFEFRSLENQRL